MTESGVAGLAAHYSGLAQERMDDRHPLPQLLSTAERKTDLSRFASELFSHLSVCPEIWRVRLQIEVGAPEGSDSQGRRELRMRRDV